MSITSTDATTTIKVPVALRDRLSVIARQQGTTLAGAIAHSLEVCEESGFWTRLDDVWTADPPLAGGVLPSDTWKHAMEPEPIWDDIYDA